MLGTEGSRGLTHPRVDKHADVPPGTTSYYFRTRQALLRGVAERVSVLDLADLSMMDEHSDRFRHEYSGTLGLARLVMLSGTEPYLTRTRARFELILQSRKDPELAVATQSYSTGLFGLATDVIARWLDEQHICDSSVEQRAVVILTFIAGVMTSFVQGNPVVSDAGHLDQMIRQILHNSAA